MEEIINDADAIAVLDEANKVLQEQLNGERMKNYELKQLIRKYQAKCEAYEHILRKIIRTAEGGAK